MKVLTQGYNIYIVFYLTLNNSIVIKLSIFICISDLVQRCIHRTNNLIVFLSILFNCIY